MFTRIISSLLMVFCLSVCNLNARTIFASDYLHAIRKIQKKISSDPVFDYIAMQRKALLLRKYYWNIDNRNSDTIYVCDVVNLKRASYNEYIVAHHHIYALKNEVGVSLDCDMNTSHEKFFEKEMEDENGADNIRLLKYVMNWDVNLFKRWSTETSNRHTNVNAVRIIRRSKYIYQYDYYSFFDNHLAENNSIPSIGKTASGETIYTSARDIGNIAAGIVAARNGIPWNSARLAFDVYQSRHGFRIEGLSTRNAEYYGWSQMYSHTSGITEAAHLRNTVHSFFERLLNKIF